jgi:hypothetical protein
MHRHAGQHSPAHFVNYRTARALPRRLGLAFLGWQRPSIPLAYDGAVRDVAVAITRDPATSAEPVRGFPVTFIPAL